MSRQNATFWSKVGKMGVGETGVGEQGISREKRTIWELHTPTVTTVISC